MRLKGNLPLALAPASISVLAATPALADNSSQSQSIVDPAGPVAQHISDLWYIVLIPALFVLVFVGGAIIYAAFKFRAKEGDTTIPKQIGGNNALESTWTLIPAMILMGIFIVSALQVPFVRRTPTEAADQVRALADEFGVDEVMVNPVASAHRGTDPATAPTRDTTLELLAKELF